MEYTTCRRPLARLRIKTEVAVLLQLTKGATFKMTFIKIIQVKMEFFSAGGKESPLSGFT